MGTREALDEAQRLEQGLLYYEHLHRLSSSWWRSLNVLLAALTVSLGALSALLQGEDDARLQATLAAVLAGVFGGILGLYSPRDLANSHSSASADCNRLRIEVRQARQIAMPSWTGDVAYEWLRAFSDRRASELAAHPPNPQFFFRFARRAIESDQIYRYDVDARVEENSGGT